MHRSKQRLYSITSLARRKVPRCCMRRKMCRGWVRAALLSRAWDDDLKAKPGVEPLTPFPFSLKKSGACTM